METKKSTNSYSHLINLQNERFKKETKDLYQGLFKSPTLSVGNYIGKKFFIFLIFLCLTSLAIFTYSTRNFFHDISYQSILNYNDSCRTSKQDGESVCGDDVYDLRIIILTFNRPKSLFILLETLDSLELDGDRAVIEIKIDVPEKGLVHLPTLQMAQKFEWSKGDVKVEIQKTHMGLIGQWIYSWKPKNKTRVVGSEMDYEICLILEDDLVVSKWAYRWLRAARNKFRKQREIMGITLQSADLINAATGGPLRYPKTRDQSFLYRLVSSWGLAPDAEHWMAFQAWYDENHESTKPYVPNTVMLKWYHSFEKSKKTDSMWTMWLLYFTYKLNLYTLFPNIHESSSNNWRSRYCLVYNRKEAGLHYAKSRYRAKYPCLYFDWVDDYVQFSDLQVYVGYNGKVVKKPVFNFSQIFNYTIA